MRKMTVPLASLALAAWFAGGFWYIQNYWLPQQANHSFSEKAPDLRAVSVSHSTIFSTANDALAFAYSSPALFKSAETNQLLDDLANYLKQHQLAISISGLYLSKENNPSSFDNLGIARAMFVQQELEQRGIDLGLIATKGEAAAQLLSMNNHLLNGVRFEFANRNLETAQAVEPLDQIRPLNLYFKSEKYQLRLTSELKAHFENIEKLLQQDPANKVFITGYTDNRGKRAANLKISRRRARAVREFMKKNGFASDQLIMEYKGPDNPIASNDTASGRKKNRRVEVRVLNTEEK